MGMSPEVHAALMSAERTRDEIPKLVQPEKVCFHMVALADEVYRLTRELKKLQPTPPPFVNPPIKGKGAWA